MKTIRVMSVIGIVWSVISILAMISVQPSSYECDSTSMLGWGIYIAIYAIAFCIVGLVISNRSKGSTIDEVSDKLIQLNSLKEKGIISTEEFEETKKKLLRK